MFAFGSGLELAFAHTPDTSLAHESGYSFPAMVAA
jgi:hypothetical protein